MIRSKSALLLTIFTASFLPSALSMQGNNLLADFSNLSIQSSEKEPLLKKVKIKKLSGHKDLIMDIKFLKNGNLVTASFDGDIKFWDIKSGKLINELESESGTCSLAIKDKHNLFVGKNHNKIHTLDFKNIKYKSNISINETLNISSIISLEEDFFFVLNSKKTSKTSFSYIKDTSKKVIFVQQGVYLRAKKVAANTMGIIVNPVDQKNTKARFIFFDIKNNKRVEYTLDTSRVLDFIVIDNYYLWLSTKDKTLQFYDLKMETKSKPLELRKHIHLLASSDSFLSVVSGRNIVIYNHQTRKKHCTFTLCNQYNYLPILTFSEQGELVVAVSNVNKEFDKAKNNDLFILDIPEKATNQEILLQ